MLDDLTKEIKAQLYERVKSPLFGAFALSWVAWNYRGLLAVLSKMSVQETVAYIDGLYPSAWEKLGYCFGGPLFTAVLFLLVYPHPARWMYGYWANQHKKLKQVQQAIEDETPLTQEEANALRKVGLAQVKEFQTQLKELVATNKELDERVKLLQEENARLISERDQFGDVAKKAQEQIVPSLASVLAEHPPSVSKVLGNVITNNEASARRNVVSLEALSATQSGQLGQAAGRQTEIQSALLALVSLDGAGELETIAERAGLGKIDARHGLDCLREKELVTLNSGRWSLSSNGRSLAVRLGLTGVFQGQIAARAEAQ